MREIRSPLDGIPSPFAARAAAVDAYLVGAYDPQVVADFAGIYSANEYYRTGGLASTFSDMFTHARASNATMVDSDGKLKWAPHNLVAYSADFASMSGSAVVTANTTTDPDGGSTADTITDNTTAFLSRRVNVSISAGVKYTAACWIYKTTSAATFPGVQVNPDSGSDDATITVDTDNGTATVRTGVTQFATNISVTSDGNFWLVKFDFTFTTVGANPNWAIYPAVNTDASGTWAATPTGSVIAWGAHAYRSDLGGMVNNPDRNDSYVPTTSSAVYLPRRNHYGWNGSTWVNKGLLLETEARTNLITYSEDFTNAAWNGSLSATASAAIDPAGGTNAYNYFEVNTTDSHNIYLQTAPSTATGPNTASCFFKAGTRNYGVCQIFTDGATKRFSVVVDLTTGLVTDTESVSSPLNTSYTVEPYGGGWFRVSVTATNTSGATGIDIAISDVAVPTAWSFGSPSYAGSSSDYITLYGAQFEAGSTPSSYIPTTGASDTRALETLTIPAAKMAWDASNVSLQMQGEITYADEGTTEQQTFARWHAGATDYIIYDLDTDSTDTGEVNFNQEDATGGAGSVAIDAYTAGVNTAYNISGRHTSGAINGATDGTATTEDTTPTALPDLSTTDFQLAYDYMGTIALFREDNNDWGDAGIAEAST